MSYKRFSKNFFDYRNKIKSLLFNLLKYNRVFFQGKGNAHFKIENRVIKHVEILMNVQDT